MLQFLFVTACWVLFVLLHGQHQKKAGCLG